jgi:hypothetical protein
MLILNIKKSGSRRAGFAPAAFPPEYLTGAALNLLLSGNHHKYTSNLGKNQGGGC